MRHRHVRSAALAVLAAGGLPPARAAAIHARVGDCAECAAELAGWRAVARAAATDFAPPPAAVLAGALARITVPEPAGGRLRHVFVVFGGQARVLRRVIWAASAVMFLLGAVICVARDSPSGTAFALIAPLIAALGVGGVAGPRADPALEVTLATPTSPRLVLLVRIALVAGCDLVLGLAVSGLLTVLGAAVAFWPLVSAWLGPMAWLSGLSVLLAVWRSPAWGASCALGVWGLRVLAAQTGPAAVLSSGQAAAITGLWGTNAPALVAAVLLVTAALLVPSRVRAA